MAGIVFPIGALLCLNRHLQRSLFVVFGNVIAQGFELLLLLWPCLIAFCCFAVYFFWAQTTYKRNAILQNAFYFVVIPTWTSALQTSALEFLRKTISEVESIFCVSMLFTVALVTPSNLNDMFSMELNPGVVSLVHVCALTPRDALSPLKLEAGFCSFRQADFEHNIKKNHFGNVVDSHQGKQDGWT